MVLILLQSQGMWRVQHLTAGPIKFMNFLKVESSLIMPDGSDFFITQVTQMELRSGKKLPLVPNFGKNLVQELSQSKNRSSPNPESPAQDHGLSQNQNLGGHPYRPKCWGHPIEPKRSYPTRETTNACWSNISG